MKVMVVMLACHMDNWEWLGVALSVWISYRVQLKTTA